MGCENSSCGERRDQGCELPIRRTITCVQVGSGTGRGNMLCEKPVCDRAMPDLESTCNICEGPRRRFYVVGKAVVEWFGALLLLAILSPVIAILAALTKLSSPGPAFYSQVRLGRFGRPYRIWKVRTMRHNCEAKTGAVWSSGLNDARVTSFGRLLRDTHLDELPQLWNVLQGDMGLIGPRPERPEIASRIDAAIPRYGNRLMVRPGVTGLAQVQLPADSDLESVRRKLGYDLYYVREVSAMMDARILLSTSLNLLSDVMHAVGKALVRTEKQVVETGNYGGLRIVSAENTWRAGAA